MELLVLDKVFVRKYDAPVLHAISFRILKGQQWAVVGGNGSGKTTLLETIAGKWAPRSGKIKRQGHLEFVASDFSFNRIVHAAAQYYQQRFSSQDAGIAPLVREVLTGQLKPVGTIDAHSVRLPPPAVSAEELRAISELLSLTHLLDHPFVTLSNGETRRMLLARSLTKQPDLLLLDYPFTGLDVHSREILRNALASLAASGMTVILATSAQEIPDFITHVAELEAGQLVYSGPKAAWQQHSGSTVNRYDHVVSSELLRRLGPPIHRDFEYAFRLRNIRVVYDGRAVLDNVSWTVKKGEHWALSGPNGSGKSTLLSIINADHPQRFANDFEIFDHPKRGTGFSMWDIKQRIGHVSPELHLYFPAAISVYNTIASGFFDATGVYFKKITPEQHARVLLVAEILTVSGLLEKTFRHLSKGEQRLVLLARALVKNPPLLILDEPCQGLDSAATEYFKSVVDAICAHSEYTLLYVSHYPHEIPSCVTKKLTLSDGRVV